MLTRPRPRTEFPCSTTRVASLQNCREACAALVQSVCQMLSCVACGRAEPAGSKRRQTLVHVHRQTHEAIATACQDMPSVPDSHSLSPLSAIWVHVEDATGCAASSLWHVAVLYLVSRATTAWPSLALTLQVAPVGELAMGAPDELLD